MKRRIYKGIPRTCRGDIWLKLLEVEKTKEEQYGIYQV